MSHPLASLRTWTLTFQVPAGYGEDPDTGARKPLTAPLRVTLFLRRSSDPTRRELPGVDQHTLFLSGRWISPMSRPANLSIGSKAPMTVDGVTGTFTLEPVVPGNVPEVEAELGERVRGRWDAAR